jgi:ABC-type lipoprotein release transport system permease subunit
MSKPFWNQPIVFLAMLIYAAAGAAALRIDSISTESRSWTPIDTDLFGAGVSVILLFGLAVALLATIYSALRGKPLRPLRAFNLATFLSVTTLVVAIFLTAKLPAS